MYFFSKGMPMLEDIRFWGWCNIAIKFDMCPNLRTLVCKNLAGQTDLIDIDDNNLRRLETSAYLDELPRILSHSPSLVDCNVFVWGRPASHLIEIAPEIPLLALPHLESLCITYALVGSTSLWDRLHLPSLKVACLALTFLNNDDATLWQSLYSFFRRSCPPLVHLELYLNVLVPEHEFIQFLSWTPSLKRVRVVFGDDTVISGMFWRALNGGFVHEEDGRLLPRQNNYIHSPTNQVICPHLEYLQLYTSTNMELNDIANTILYRFLACDHSTFPPTPAVTTTGLHTLRAMSIAECRFSLQELLSVAGLRQTVTAIVNADTRFRSLSRLAVRSLCAKPTDAVWKLECWWN